MIQSNIVPQRQMALAFDNLALSYDDLFTRSLVGRAQRNAVWDILAKVFTSDDRILELNCGTGEDAVFLARRGVSVFACDASEGMVEVARRRVIFESLDDKIQVEHLPTEGLGTLSQLSQFDGVLSNFSGLNCVADLATIAQQLAQLVRPGAPIVLCLCTRFCLFEIIWYLLQGHPRKAFRRTSGRAVARLEGFEIQLQYPTLRELRQVFSKDFNLRFCRGVGILVPPSYTESWIRRYPQIIGMLESIDRLLCDLPWFRVIGDHFLVCFERVVS
jgi:SAM-dependent methyltransferase